MTAPLVLMPGPMHDVVMTGCAEHFEVLRLWEHDDPAEALAARGDDVRALANGGHGRVDAELMDRLPNLEIVAGFGVGYDTVDAAEAARRGVVVTNAAGSLDNEVADTAIGLVLMTVRELSQAERYLRAGRWPDGDYPLTTATVTGRTMGILGLGRIGRAIARRAEAFDMSVGYHNRHEKDVPYRYFTSLIEMAEAVDTLVVMVPGGTGTQNVVDREVLEALGPDGILINVARGSVVDEDALIAALRAGTIRGAGLDVYAHEPHVPQELLDLEQVVLLPHVGSASVPTREAMARLCVDNLVAWFGTGRPLTPVPESEGLVGAHAP